MIFDSLHVFVCFSLSFGTNQNNNSKNNNNNHYAIFYYGWKVLNKESEINEIKWVIIRKNRLEQIARDQKMKRFTRRFFDGANTVNLIGKFSSNENTLNSQRMRWKKVHERALRVHNALWYAMCVCECARANDVSMGNNKLMFISKSISNEFKCKK